MGTSMWVYKVNADDTVERVSAKKFYRLYTDGNYCLFPDDGGREVRFVLLTVKLKNKRFDGILGVGFSKIEIAPDGNMEGDYKIEALRGCALEWPGDVESAPPAKAAAPSKVVDAQKKIP